MKTVKSALRLLGKPMSYLLSNSRVISALEFIDTGINYVTGKGSGSHFERSGEIKALSHILPKNKPLIIVDVGANDGAWSLRLSQHLSADAVYHLFECADYCFPSLEERASRLPNSVIHKMAVSDAVKDVTLYMPTRGSGLASLHERHDVSVVQEQYTQTIVHTTTIDLLRLSEIDLLKLDIEGHELAALKGAEQSMSDGKIKFIQFEFGSANVNSRTYFKDFYDLLTAYGFNVYRVLPCGRLSHIPKYSETLEYFRGATNYIAKLCR